MRGNDPDFPILITLFCYQLNWNPSNWPIFGAFYLAKTDSSQIKASQPTNFDSWSISGVSDVISHRNSQKKNLREKSLKRTFSLNGCEYSCLASRIIKFRIEVPSRVKSSHFFKRSINIKSLTLVFNQYQIPQIALNELFTFHAE